MEKGDYLTAILKSEKTVFTFKEIVLLWGDIGSDAVRARVYYYVKTKKLIQLRRGLYVKNDHYNPLELATKIFTPAYVSFETVLVQNGIIFQYYRTIFVASYLSRNITCGAYAYSFKKVKPLLLTSFEGIEHENECSIATKERAFLDTLYLNKTYHFDRLDPLDWDRVYALLPLYQNQRMEKQVKALYENHLRDQ